MHKIILITGATAGIGLSALESLAKTGHEVIFTARDEEKAIRIKNEVIKGSNAKIDYIKGDFASLQEVKNLAEKFSEKYPKLDVLINNAGTWEMERKQSKDGIEMNFAVNHLAPFLLTLLLLPALKKSEAGRIINTSSMAHRRNILKFDDIEFKNQEYNGVSTYSQSKICNILFTLQLQKELRNTKITVNTVHPGYVKSDLFKNMGERDWDNIPDSSYGARSTLYAALSPELEGISGKYIYLENEDVTTDMAKDENLAKKLWDLSIKYVEKFL